MFWVALIIAVVTTFLAAYIYSTQATAYVIGRLLAGFGPHDVGLGAMDSILPMRRNTFKITLVLLVVAELVVISVSYGAGHWFWVMLLCFGLQQVLVRFFPPLKPCSGFMESAIRGSLARQRMFFVNSDNNYPASVLADLIDKIDQISPELLDAAGKKTKISPKVLMY